MSSVAPNNAPAQAETAAATATKDLPQDVPHIAVANIPAQLKALPQWVCWKYETRDGKRTKPPYNAQTGGKASSTDPATWSTFEASLAALESGSYAGIGFVLTKESGLIGIDLDHVLDGVQGVMEWPHGSRLRIQPAEVVALLDTYTEVTPSGAGLRCFVFGELPPGWRKAGDAEIYDSGRFLTVTGHHWPDSPPTIGVRPGEVAALHAGMLPPPMPPSNGLNGHAGNGSNGNGGGHMTASELWDVMFRAKNGQRIRQLFDGAWQAAGYGSQSEADSALCHDLAFYAQGDAVRVDGLFRETGLFREKWDKRHYGSGETYGLHTVSEACRRTVKHYTGPASRFTVNISSGTRPSQQATESNKLPEFALTDVGNADRLAYFHGCDLRYSYKAKRWFIWNGQRWAEDETGEIERRAEATAREILTEATRCTDDDTRQKTVKWAMSSMSNARIKDMMERARSKLAIRIEDFDLDLNLLNCQNGTFNLQTGQLQPHCRDNLLTKIVPVEYEPDADCPAFKKFIISIMAGDKELIAFLQKAVGYALSGSVQEQCLFMLYGTGKNGKSTLLELLTELLADYATTCPAETLMAHQGDRGIPNDVARLRGARFVSAIETEEGKRLAEVLVKQLTGGDTVTARFLHQEFFSFKPQFKIFLATNHQPVIKGTGDAIWRRIHLIPFAVQFWNPDSDAKGDENRRMDKTLPARLRQELPGILNWCIEGHEMWKSAGLGLPEKVKSSTKDYRERMDVLLEFLTDQTQDGADKTADNTKIYKVYENWCRMTGEESVSRKAFSQSLVERGYQPDRDKTHRFWKGLALIQEHFETGNGQYEPESVTDGDR